MRILLTIADLAMASGGPTQSATRTAQELRALGADSAIACGVRAGVSAAADGVELLPIASSAGSVSRALQAPRYRRQLLQRARQWAPDVIYDFGLWLPQNAASAAAARRLGRPWICSPRGMLEPWSLGSGALRKKIAWRLYQRRLLEGAAALVATSEEERRHLQQLLPRAPVWLVPNGVDLPPPGSAPRRRQAVFLSRLHPKKQPELLIRLWARLRPAGWRLVLAGPADDDYRAS
ncbi:MAG TPA: glycosyltransferase, partial [Nevskiaceae bacterium]|nr:glycosyltransferase [Nevskiaceae bacterium]